MPLARQSSYDSEGGTQSESWKSIPSGQTSTSIDRVASLQSIRSNVSESTSRSLAAAFNFSAWDRLFGYISGGRRKRGSVGKRSTAIKHAMDKKGTLDLNEQKPWFHAASQTIIWSSHRIIAYRIAHSKAMDVMVIALIISNVSLIIYETDEEAQCYPTFAKRIAQCATNPQNITWLQISNWAILIAYTLEALLRICADRCAYFRSGMNLLDLSVCIIDWAGRVVDSMVPLSWLRIFRVFRLCRAFRIVQAIPELNALLMGFKGSMRAVLFGSGVLFLMLMFCSILLVQFVHPVSSRLDFTDCDRCSRGFASVMASTLTLFSSVVAGDSWGLISIPVIEEQWYAGILLPFTMQLIGVGAMNLILAVIVDKAVEAREKNKEHLWSEKKKESYRRRTEMLGMFHDMDTNASGTLDPREIEQALLGNKRFRRFLKLCEVSHEDIFCILDCLENDQSDEIAYKDFCDILEHFQAADMRKVSVLTNMMVSDLRRHLKADRDCTLSSIRDLVLEVKQKIDNFVLNDSVCAKQCEGAEIHSQALAGTEKPLLTPTSAPRSSQQHNCPHNVAACELDSHVGKSITDAILFCKAEIDSGTNRVQQSLMQLDTKCLASLRVLEETLLSCVDSGESCGFTARVLYHSKQMHQILERRRHKFCEDFVNSLEDDCSLWVSQCSILGASHTAPAEEGRDHYREMISFPRSPRVPWHQPPLSSPSGRVPHTPRTR